MSSERGIVDILRLEGIMAQGYGMNPKIVMRDKRLSPEAKCIYSYLSSFAGGGNQAFPGRDIMMEELQMGKTRYYKHLKLLIDAGYIRVDRVQEGNIYGKNIYTIVALPSPVVSESKSDANKETIDKNQERPISIARKPKKLPVKKRASINELRERLKIDALKEEEPTHADLVEEVFMAIEDMDVAEQIRIGGNVKKREAIEDLLNRLMPEHIRLVVQSVAENKKTLVNRKAYLQTCIANSIFDINNPKQEVGNSPREKVKQKEVKKQQDENRKKQMMQQAYAEHPELKNMDAKLIELSKEMSKAVLSGNEILHKKLQSTYTELNDKRNAFTAAHGLQDCQ